MFYILTYYRLHFVIMTWLVAWQPVQGRDFFFFFLGQGLLSSLFLAESRGLRTVAGTQEMLNKPAGSHR